MEMISEIISSNDHAPVVVIFGGNPYRREEVINHLQSIGDITIYGTLSEEEGMKKLSELSVVNLVLIGGRYTEEQRIKIRSYIKSNMPDTKITEPGYDYPYDNMEILNQVKSKLKSA